MATRTESRLRRRRWRWASLATAGALLGLWLASTFDAPSWNRRTLQIDDAVAVNRTGAEISARPEDVSDERPDAGMTSSGAAAAQQAPSTTADPDVEAEATALQQAVSAELANDQ
jgi:hypothetical protein